MCNQRLSAGSSPVFGCKTIVTRDRYPQFFARHSRAYGVIYNRVSYGRCFLRAGRVQTHEGAAVLLAQQAHQRRETYAGVFRKPGIGKHGRKSYPMDTDQAVAFPVSFVDPVHRLYHFVDGLTRKLVAQHIEIYLSIRGGSRKDAHFLRTDDAALQKVL